MSCRGWSWAEQLGIAACHLSPERRGTGELGRDLVTNSVLPQVADEQQEPGSCVRMVCKQKKWGLGLEIIA